MPHCMTMALLVAPPLPTGPRPASVGFVDHDSLPIRCHYPRESLADRCPQALTQAAEAWAAQVDGWGWPAPFPDDGVGGSDALDIYFSADASGGAYVASDYEDADRGDGRMGGSSWLVLDPSIQPDELYGYMAHEFNHVLQFATDMSEPTLPIWEATATWAEEVTYPGLGSAPLHAADFQLTPWVGLLGDGYQLWDDFEIWSYYEYGAALWLHQAAEQGIDPLDIWEGMVNPSWDNEPDVLDTYGALGGGLEQTLATLARDRAWVGTEQAPEWADAFSHAPVGVAGELVEPGDRVTPEYMPYETGMVYVDLQAEGPVQLRVDGDPSVSWLLVPVDQGDAELVDGLVTVVGPQRLAVVNLGGPEFDGDDAPVMADVALEFVDYGEVGDTGLSSQRVCGCAGVGAASGWVWLFGLLGLWRRRG